ncbi:host specificity protein J, partial [Shigella flexneri]|nr:host specificity protein J [Shigella flexneri]
EPRFAVNVYLQSQQDAFTVLQSLSSIFRGMAYWNGEQVTVAMDAPQTPVYTFSCANVVDGIFNYTGTRARDRHTVAKVAWDNPKNDFKTEYEPVRDEYAIAKYGINQLDINMMGCTSQGQAQRAGLWALKSEQLENRQVSFSIGLDGMLERIKPSAIIAISDEVFAGRANGGRIVAVSSDKRTITLDRAVTANVGDTLVINNSDGVAERQTISAINGADITVSVAFDKPEVKHIWAIDSPNLRLMLFKIISIKQNDDLTHTITAIQHEPQKYAAVDSGAYVQPQRVSVVEPNIVAAPEAVAIGQFERQIQGQTVVTMTIGWTQVKDAVSYIVEFKRDDGNWVKLAPQGGLSVDVEGVYAGNYLARVTAVNAYDLQSMPKTSMLTAVVGKLGTPPSLASLKATGILFGMQLDWLFAQGSSDTNYTEIQVASAPDTNVALLGTYAYPTNTATINGLQG